MTTLVPPSIFPTSLCWTWSVYRSGRLLKPASPSISVSDSPVPPPGDESPCQRSGSWWNRRKGKYARGPALSSAIWRHKQASWPPPESNRDQARLAAAACVGARTRPELHICLKGRWGGVGEWKKTLSLIAGGASRNRTLMHSCLADTRLTNALWIIPDTSLSWFSRAVYRRGKASSENNYRFAPFACQETQRERQAGHPTSSSIQEPPPTTHPPPPPWRKLDWFYACATSRHREGCECCRRRRRGEMTRRLHAV